MSKAVMISIRPKWCNLIGSGKKTIEVRKTRPKIKAPFKCYIYCTQDKHDSFICRGGDDMPFDVGNGMVIGEFVCDKIGEAHWMQDFGYAGIYKEWDDVADCLTNQQIYDYMGENDILFGWHISDLVIYDQPKELREFRRWEKLGAWEYPKKITRAPQSFMYVEAL